MAAAADVRALAVEVPFRVNGYDVDFQGVVHNVVYVRWFEDLRMRLLDEHLPLAGQVAAGFAPMLTETRVAYRRPIRMADRPVGRLWLTEAGRARWSVGIEIVVGDAVAATGAQSGVFVDLATLRPVRVPAVFVEAVERARAAAGPVR